MILNVTVAANVNDDIVDSIFQASVDWERRNRRGPQFSLSVERVQWREKPVNAKNILCSAIHVSQPTYDSVLKEGIILENSWCSYSIYTAALFMNGAKRSIKPDDLGNIAVFRAPVTLLERRLLPFKHYRVNKDTDILGVLTVRVGHPIR